MKLIGTALLIIGFFLYSITRTPVDMTLKELNSDFNSLKLRRASVGRTFTLKEKISEKNQVGTNVFYKFKESPKLYVTSSRDVGDAGETIKFRGVIKTGGRIAITAIYRNPKSLYLAGIGASLIILGIIRSRIIRNRGIKEAQPKKQEDSKAKQTPNP
ncbi:hypothetical protein OAG84_01800 [Akkermansiaceae bacterium]|jgi:hypothetical protein|nr:hypothetical protein [Akkermansiaceae bacterium]MDB4746979.1 hypothetical protein [Akkermansiaceae bacterium]MDB4805705.1 hypothetical protein [Akkermansiaceae bacterium]